MKKLAEAFTDNCELLPHQIIGLSWMLRQELEGGENKCGGILADEMGLGKVFSPYIKGIVAYSQLLRGIDSSNDGIDRLQPCSSHQARDRLR
jgi:hypothetical protein